MDSAELRNAFPDDACPSYLLHDRDATLAGVASTIQAMLIQKVVTSPWLRGRRSRPKMARILKALASRMLEGTQRPEE